MDSINIFNNSNKKITIAYIKKLKKEYNLNVSHGVLLEII